MNTENKNTKSTNARNSKSQTDGSSKSTRISASGSKEEEKGSHGDIKSDYAKENDSKSRKSSSSKSGRISASIDKDEKKGERNSSTRSDDKPCAESAQSEFHKFFVDAVKDIYWAEQHLAKGLRKMSKAATSPKLAAAFDKHIAESDKQTAVIEQIFELLGEKPAAKRCAAMVGLLEEAESAISDTEKNSFVRDAALIMASQKAKHYEIATYGTLAALAEYLPEKKVATLLSKILAGEKKTDGSLTKLAEDFVNECAAVE